MAEIGRHPLHPTKASPAICCSSLRLNQWSKMLSVNWLKWSLSLRSNVISILVICVSLPEFALGLISLAPYVTVWSQVNATASWGEKTLFCLRTLTESTWQKYWEVTPFMHFLIFQYKRLIWLRRQARRWRLSSGVNVYWSRKTWACKFWFVCACCLQGSCRAESITIGMWTWLLERLWKSHRPMIKNSVRASLQPHHSECLHKGTVHSKKIKKSYIQHNCLNSALCWYSFLYLDCRNTFNALSKKDGHRIFLTKKISLNWGGGVEGYLNLKSH